MQGPGSYKETAQRLREIAFSQEGFFTTKQAIRAGLSEKVHSYHVKRGNWLREHRGIYRLADFPTAGRPDLMLWYLWSQNRQEVAEGTYSHDTALSLHELSDLMPSSLHMTVPKAFRRSGAVPKILVLHRANLDAGEVQEMHGVRVTRPLRTILDLLESGGVDRSQLKLAMDEALRRGLITRKEIEQTPNSTVRHSLEELVGQTRMSGEEKIYKTAGAFRTAIETRLQKRAREEGTDLQRLRRQVSFDRFLARMFSKGPKADYPWVLKGGYAMELRTHSARTTKDINITLHDGTGLSKDPKQRREQIRAMLQEAAAVPFDDYFEFLVGEAREDLNGAPEGGSRYPIEGRMDGRDFARFAVDVGIGDEVLEPLDVVRGEDWLGFGGVEPPSIPIISAEQQFAEKLHAYTLPRGERTNTRTKDLVDMVLLIREEKLDPKKTTAAIATTFAKRTTHGVPANLGAPPVEWQPVFDALAKECKLEMQLADAFQLVQEFYHGLTPL